MKTIFLLTLFTLAFYYSNLFSQTDSTFEIGLENKKSIDNPELRVFYDKFNEYMKGFNNNGENKLESKIDSNMIYNFIVFSEDGLIMKDLNFHSLESCKKEVLAAKEQLSSTNRGKAWLYVDLESHVNKKQLIEVLLFLKQNSINYKFGSEDYYVPLITNMKIKK